MLYVNGSAPKIEHEVKAAYLPLDANICKSPENEQITSEFGAEELLNFCYNRK